MITIVISDNIWDYELIKKFIDNNYRLYYYWHNFRRFDFKVLIKVIRV